MGRFIFPALLGLTFLTNVLSTSTTSQFVVSENSGTHVSDNWSYENCGVASDRIQVKSINISPGVPEPGKDLTIAINVDVTDTIEEGAYADLVIEKGPIKMLQKRVDLCEAARSLNASIQCPVEPGGYTISRTIPLPQEMPRAQFGVNVNGYTNENETMLCVVLKVDLTKQLFPSW